MDTVRIVDRKTRRIVDAEVVANISRSELKGIDHLWVGWRADLTQKEMLPENHDWRWERKGLDLDADSFRFLGIRYLGEIQGLAMLNMDSIASQRPGCSGQRMLYVEYLEAAPWNQEAYAGTDKRYGLIGMALLCALIMVSADAGCEGRIALHSLPQAEGFYRLNFYDLG
jgi:hypothetical protein